MVFAVTKTAHVFSLQLEDRKNPKQAVKVLS